MRSAVVVLGLAVLAAGCRGSGSTERPFVLDGPMAGGGRPFMGVGPDGAIVRYVERGRFAYALTLRNRSDRRVTLVDAQARTASGGLVHQIGASAASWEPVGCGGHSCPPGPYPFSPPAAERMTPFLVDPTKYVAVELDFRLDDCSHVPAHVTSPTRLLDLVYRDAGTRRRQTISLPGPIRLRNPTVRDCAHQPTSNISVQGGGEPGSRYGYGSSSEWSVPASNGDVCTTGGGALHFRSRLFKAPFSYLEQVLIDLPSLRGAGLYRTLGRARGPATVTLRARKDGRWERDVARISIVTVDRTGADYGGRFRGELGAALTDYFRTYGRWRCVVRG